MNALKIPRDFRTFADAALQQGWHITCTSRGHLRWQSPQGKCVFTAATPSDQRAVQNVRADLRRYGLAGV